MTWLSDSVNAGHILCVTKKEIDKINFQALSKEKKVSAHLKFPIKIIYKEIQRKNFQKAKV